MVHLLYSRCIASEMALTRFPVATSLETVGRVTAGVTEAVCARAAGGCTIVP